MLHPFDVLTSAGRGQVLKGDTEGKLSRRGFIEAKYSIENDFEASINQVWF